MDDDWFTFRRSQIAGWIVIIGCMALGAGLFGLLMALVS